MEHAKIAHERKNQSIAGAQKAAIEAANVTIRALILVNGGAVIALLAFIGALETGNSDIVQVGALVTPIRWFALGVGFSAVTAVLSYLINLLDSDIHSSVSFTWEHPYIENKPAAKRLRFLRNTLHVLALASGSLSLWSFFKGIFTVTEAIALLGA